MFQLDKRAVIRNADHLAQHLVIHGISVGHAFPGMVLQLLQAQGNALALRVEIEHLHLDLLPDGQFFRGMPDPPPGDIRDVQQPVQAAQVDKRAKVRDVFDRALADLPDFQCGENLLTQPRAFLFEHHAAGNHDISAIFVELDDAKREHLADEAIEIFDLFEVDLRAGQKRIHAEQIDHDAALDSAHQPAFDNLVRIVRVFDAIPHPHKIGFGLGQHHLAFLIFDAFQKDLDLIALFNRGGIPKFGEGNHALGLEPDIDQHRVVVDGQHRARHNFALLDGLERVFVELHHFIAFRIAVFALIAFIQRGESFFGRGKGIDCHTRASFQSVPTPLGDPLREAGATVPAFRRIRSRIAR